MASAAGSAAAQANGSAPAGDGNGSRRAKSDAVPVGTLLRSLPQSEAAEAAVLGSMIVDPRCIGDVIELVNRDAFYQPAHQLMFAMIERVATE